MRCRLLACLLFLPRPSSAGLLTAQGAAVLDTGLAARASFTNTEKIVFQQRVHNGVASANRIAFRFVVLSPSGAQVFEHAGNSVPGAVGSAASSVSGIPISQLYTGPGIYTLRAQATLDGATLEQQAGFTVSSPNILLVYPPNGAQGVADVPLTFRWSSSGASQYRVTVGDNPSFYNSVFGALTSGGETFLSYPENPPDPRQRLSAGQLYYWKVEGLDATGLKVAESAAPFGFTVQSAALAKDLAVTDLAAQAAGAPGAALSFTITVKNQGGTAEAGVALKFSVGGLAAPGTPIAMAVLSPAEQRQYTVSHTLPVDQKQSLAIACIEFSDDNIANNCKTLLVSQPEAPAAGGAIFSDTTASLSKDQLWQMIQEILKSKGFGDLSGYKIIGIDGSTSAEDLRAIIEGLRQGEVKVNLTGPTPGAPAPVLVAKPAPLPGLAPAPVPPPLAAGSPKEEEFGSKQFLKALAEFLKSLGGLVDLSDYKMVGISGDVDPESLKAILDGVKKGEVKVSLSGPVPGPKAPYLPPPPPGALGDDAAAAAARLASQQAALKASAEDGETGGMQWTGLAQPYSDGMDVLTIRDADDFARAWKRLSERRVPKVNFERYMVVGLVAEKGQRVDRIDIEEVRRLPSAIVVRYRMVVQERMTQVDGARRASRRTTVPYVLVAMPVSAAAVRFEEADYGRER